MDFRNPYRVRRPYWIAFVLTLALAFLTPAQQQQSGGVTLSGALPSGSNIIGKVGIDQSTPGTTNLVSIGTNGTVAINAALPAGANAIGTVAVNAALPAGANAIGTVALNAAIPAGANSIGTVVNGAGTASIGKVTDNTTCGTTVLAPAWAAIPTSSTAVTATTTCVEAIIFTNTNGSAQTVTVTDGQATAVTVLNAFSIPANSQVTFPFYGTPMTTGIKWLAGGTGITGTVKGYQ